MKRKHYSYIFIILVLTILLLSISAGCGKSPESPAVTPTPPTVTPSTVESAESSGGNEPQQDPAPSQQDVITVSGIEELLEAIAPDTVIMIEPGYYNMSEYLEYVWAKEGESWNKSHPYVQLRDCYDGVEVVIRRVDGLSICGDSENLTEIVVDPRYAQVLNFEECYNITLSGLTMGHTDTGSCSGNVLNFYSCRNINLSAMDLYGCGVYGIGCFNGTGELYTYSSTIRDCAYGALEILDGNGRFEFHNCGLTGSEARDWYEATPYSELAFYECVFGVNETSYYMFHEDVYTEDCVWSESYTAPEYSYEDWPVFDPETMESASIDSTLLNNTTWFAYAMVNPESGETVMFPFEEPDGTNAHISLSLYDDGSGVYEYNGTSSDISWNYHADASIPITFGDGRSYYITTWTMAGESYIWLLLEQEECLVWLY